MFELSDTELQILEELWKLIQTGRTTQEMPSEDVSSRTSLTMPQPPHDPLTEGQIGVLRHRFTDRT